MRETRQAGPSSFSAIVRAGLAVTCITTAMTLGGAWWTLDTHRRAATDSDVKRIVAVAEVLGGAVEPLLAAGELTAVRRQVMEAAFYNSLERCRVLLGGEQVIADADPKQIDAPTRAGLPPSWSGGLPPPDIGTVTGDRVHVVKHMRVPGRGLAALEVESRISDGPVTRAELTMGLGAVASAGLAALLLCQRWIQARLRALLAIGGSLRAFAKGDDSLESLRVAPSLGPDALAWNTVIEERHACRTDRALDHATERRRAPAGQDSLGGACDALWHGMLLLDQDLRVTYANNAAGVLLRTAREDLLGAPLMTLLGEEAPEAIITGVAQGATKQRQSFELRRRAERAPGSAPGAPVDASILRVGVRPARKGDTASVVVLIEDVTQQRVADDARSAFVAQASHELRTPLTNIRLYTESLLEDSAEPVARAKALNVINQESLRLERIVADMLSMAEIEAGSMRLRVDDVRWDAVLEELKRDYAAQAEDKQIALNYDFPPKFPVTRGDRDKVVLALHNLLGNALKYTPVGGAITVKATFPGDNQPGEALTIDVTDNGIGIREDEQELIFEKFYRARDKRIANISGTGLGLTLARQVARMHGGDVTVKSQVGKGSTFTLRLPATPVEARRAA